MSIEFLRPVRNEPFIGSLQEYQQGIGTSGVFLAGHFRLDRIVTTSYLGHYARGTTLGALWVVKVNLHVVNVAFLHGRPGQYQPLCAILDHLDDSPGNRQYIASLSVR